MKIVTRWCEHVTGGERHLLRGWKKPMLCSLIIVHPNDCSLCEISPFSRISCTQRGRFRLLERMLSLLHSAQVPTETGNLFGCEELLLWWNSSRHVIWIIDASSSSCGQTAR
jgi:hypothetical protein